MPAALTTLLLVALAITTAGCSAVLPANTGRGASAEDEAVVRSVGAAGERPVQSGQAARPFQSLKVELTSGPLAGQVVAAEAQLEPNAPFRFSPGDRVLVQQVATPQSQQGQAFVVVDSVRLPTLQWLGVLFLLLVLWVGRRRGVTALLGLVISFAVVTQGMLPLLATGAPPAVVGVASSCVILVITLYLAHGFNRTTTVAVVATAIALAVSGLMAFLAVDMARLTGISEEGLYLQAALPNVRVDMRGLLQAGILIAMLGVLDDITVGQSAVVFALRAANPALGARELYRRGMNVGREHIASLVNTLVLVYAGAALPLLLFLAVDGMPLGAALNREILATEVVRTMVGSIALVAAVPLTTALAAWTAGRLPAGEPPRNGSGAPHLHAQGEADSADSKVRGVL
jgi:uncharacterized membrane protein